MKTFKWIPQTLDGIYPDGTRWVLYQTNHRKGYPHYIGRVCKYSWLGGTGYVSEADEESRETTMVAAALKLLNWARKNDV